MDVGQCAAERRAGRVLGHEVGDRRRDLHESSLEVAQRVTLQPVDGHCDFGHGALTAAERLTHEFVCLGQPARRESEHRARRVELPQLGRLSELLEEAALGFERGLRFAQISGHELSRALVVERVDDALRVADPLGDLAEFCAEPEALGDRIRSADGGEAAVEREGECDGAAGAAGELDGLRAQLVAAVTRVFVSKRSCQAGQEPGPKLDVLLG